MPSGLAYEEAVKIAKKNPKLGIGIHLSLTWGMSCLPKKAIPDLVDEDRYFYPSFLGIMLKAFFLKRVRFQIKKEFEAQIKKVLNSGIRPDHLNGQVHVHFLPFIFPIVCSLSKKYKISYVRIPLEPLFALPTFPSLIKWGFLQTIGIILRLQGASSKNKVVFFGVLFTSTMRKKTIKKIIHFNKNHFIEILSHPGELNLGKMRSSYSRQNIEEFIINKNRILELSALLDRETAIAFHKKNIRLTTFRGLA